MAGWAEISKLFQQFSLGAHVIREALKRADIPGETVDNVLMGMVLQGGAARGCNSTGVSDGKTWE